MAWAYYDAQLDGKPRSLEGPLVFTTLCLAQMGHANRQSRSNTPPHHRNGLPFPTPL